MMRAAALLAVLTGCFIKPDRPGTGGGSGSDGGGSGSDAAPTCTAYGPWSAATVIASSKSTDYLELDPALSPDGKYLVFTRQPMSGAADSTLWMMTVDGTTFGPPLSLGFGTNVVEATWAPAGDTLYAVAGFARVTYSFHDGAFGSMQPTSEFDSLSAQRPEGRFTVAANGTDIFYEISVSNTTRLFHATGTLGGSWASTGELTELETLGTYQATPQISGDGKELLYSTMNGGNAVLVSAKRDTAMGAFGGVALIPNQLDGERPTISHVGTLMVYNSADFDLVYATRTCQ